MKTANGAALLAKAMQFADSENSVAGEAAKEFAEILQGYIKQKQFDSGSFDDDVISFLTIDPERLDEMDDEVITKFIETCRKKNALVIVRRFAQIAMSQWFDISYEKLLLIGSVVANIGLKNEGALVIRRASEKMQAESNG